MAEDELGRNVDERTLPGGESRADLEQVLEQGAVVVLVATLEPTDHLVAEAPDHAASPLVVARGLSPFGD